MRALLIAENLDRPETHLLRGLAGRGVRVRLLAPPTAGAAERLADAGVETHPVRLNGRIDPLGIRTIREQARRFRPDVVHCLRSNRPVANALLALRRSPVPIVCYRGTLGNLGRWDPGSRLTYLSRRLDRIICVSDAVREDLARLIPRDRLITIYKGHDPAWYPHGKRDLTEFGIPAGAFVVGCTANFRPLKGADVLIASLAHLATARPVHLLLVGEVRDPHLARLAARPPARGAVHLAGFRADAAALSGACDLFAMPSLRREGLPRAVIEAMAQSVPAVVSRVGGLPELVADGETGFVVPPGDPAALARAIAALADDPARTRALGAAARRRIETVFGVQAMIDRTLALYQDCAGQPGG